MTIQEFITKHHISIERARPHDLEQSPRIVIEIHSEQPITDILKPARSPIERNRDLKNAAKKMFDSMAELIAKDLKELEELE